MNQRQIKFRAWGVNSKEYLVNGRGITLQEIQAIPDITTWEFEQFTGLLDKKGKEIYEGDLLLRKLVNGEDCVEKVHWGKSGWIPNGFWKWEIIGNIHENPELIKP